MLTSFRSKHDLSFSKLMTGIPSSHLKLEIEAQAGPENINPFHDAVMGGHLETVQLLLEKVGARLLTIRTGKGKTVFDLAPSEEMKTLLQEFESATEEISSSCTPSQSLQSSQSSCCSSRKDSCSTLNSGVVALYHGICGYLEVHHIFSLWKLIVQEMHMPSERESIVTQQFLNISAEEVHHLCNDFSHLYNLERRLKRLKSRFKEDEDGNFLKSLIQHLVMFSQCIRPKGT